MGQIKDNYVCGIVLNQLHRYKINKTTIYLCKSHWKLFFVYAHVPIDKTSKIIMERTYVSL